MPALWLDASLIAVLGRSTRRTMHASIRSPESDPATLRCPTASLRRESCGDSRTRLPPRLRTNVLAECLAIGRTAPTAADSNLRRAPGVKQVTGSCDLELRRLTSVEVDGPLEHGMTPASSRQHVPQARHMAARRPAVIALGAAIGLHCSSTRAAVAGARTIASRQFSLGSVLHHESPTRSPAISRTIGSAAAGLGLAALERRPWRPTTSRRCSRSRWPSGRCTRLCSAAR